MTGAATRMNLEDFMVSRRSPSRQDNYFMIPLTCDPWSSGIRRQKADGVASGWQVEKMGTSVVGTEFQSAA